MISNQNQGCLLSSNAIKYRRDSGRQLSSLLCEEVIRLLRKQGAFHGQDSEV